MTEPTGNSPAEKAVLIGIPAYHWVEPSTTRFVGELCAHTSYGRPDIVVGIQVLDSFPAAGCKHCYQEGSDYKDARNKLVQAALDGKYTHLCMMDADMDRSANQAKGSLMLRSLLDANKDVIGPVFMRRSTPFDILARRYTQYGVRETITPEECQSGKIIEVAEIGGGMMVIDCRIFKDMSFPWFAFEVRDNSMIPEDINFCRKVRQKGYKVFCHTGWHLDHIGSHRYTPAFAFDMYHLSRDKQAQEIMDELKQEMVPEVAVS